MSVFTLLGVLYLIIFAGGIIRAIAKRDPGAILGAILIGAVVCGLPALGLLSKHENDGVRAWR